MSPLGEPQPGASDLYELNLEALGLRADIDELEAELERTQIAERAHYRTALENGREVERLREDQSKRMKGAFKLQDDLTLAEAEVDRYREALRLAVHAFAQYAEETNTPSQEALDGYTEGFLQDADLRAAVGGDPE